eukprot:jgi/Orpsp1_1/1192351/evm.model.d7180000092518.1
MVDAKEFIIHNNDYSFTNINYIVNNYQDDNELILNFVDTYYDMRSLNIYSVEVNVNTNILFIGNKNGTKFDYNNDRLGRFIFIFNNKNLSVNIENIIFENFDTNGVDLIGVQILLINTYKCNFHFIMNNCVFENNKYRLIDLVTTCTNENQLEPQILFKNINFYNNSQRVLGIEHKYEKYNSYLYKDSIIKMENCYISKLKKDTNEDTTGILLYSYLSRDLLSIQDCKFEDIDIKDIFPLINSNGLTLEIDNSTFYKCYSEYGYLFNINNHNKEQYIKINNSFFS